jgi:hypothetical protein
MARFIMSQARSSDAIILDAPNQAETFSYYYSGTTPVYKLPIGINADSAQTQAALDNILKASRRIYVLYWGETERDPNRLVESTLNSRAFPVQSSYYGKVRLALYAVPGAPPTAPTIEINQTFGGLMTLEGATISPTAPLRGDVTAITLFWHAEQPIPKRYKIFIHLLDAKGTIAAQRDSEPGGGAALTTTWKAGERVIDQHGLLIDGSLSAGTYRLIMGVYDLDQPTVRLKVGDVDFIELGRLTLR